MSASARTNERALLVVSGAVAAGLLLAAGLPDPGSSPRTRLVRAPRPAPTEEDAAAASSPGSGPSLRPAVVPQAPAPAPEPPDEPEPAVVPPLPEPVAPPLSRGGSGRVEGRVTWKGAPPPPLPDIEFSAEKAVGCDHDGAMDTTSHRLRVSASGGVRDVVVYLEPQGFDASPPALLEPALVNQIGCRFEPHVLVMPLGSTVRYLNSDPVTHNVNIKARRNRSDNQNSAVGSQVDYTPTLDEEINVICDIHPWMGAKVVVTSRFFGITDADGALVVDDLPAGAYKVTWWHDVLGKGKRGSVTVEDGGTAQVSFEVSQGGGGRGR